MITKVEQVILTHANEYADKPAIIFGERKVTYKELACLISISANAFKNKYGLCEQNVVVLSAERSIDYIIAYLALHLLNVIVVPVDENIVDQNLDEIVKKTRAILVVGKRGESVNSISYSDIFDNDFGKDEIIFPNTSEIADIMFTSGTTGEPKGVVLSHANLLASTRNISGFIGNTETDIEVLALPLCHSFGLGRLRSSLFVGATVVIFNGFSNVKALFRTIKETNATGFAMVPSGWHIIKLTSGNRISNFSSQLKYIEMGSSFLSAEEKNELAELLPQTRICMHYGLTEASRSTFLEFHAGNLESVGKPIGDCEIMILNDNNNLSLNGEGEICIKGTHVIKEYWNNNTLTRESFVNGYFKTGDIGYISNGLLFLTGRIKDIINSGGKKISALEIEEVSKKFDGVEDCACIGVKSKMLGEEIKLFLEVSKEFNLDALKQYLKQTLEQYKQPSFYEIVEQIPRTHNGKVKKYLLQ